MNSFKKACSEEAVIGTSWWGDLIFMSYDELVDKLGEPHLVNPYGDKVQYEWVFVDNEGRPATVYDWKEYDNRYPTEWHVGARNRESVAEFLAWFEGIEG